MSMKNTSNPNETTNGAYLNYICILFFLAYGLVSLDASSVSYISDVIMQELSISVKQYSVLSSSIWCTKAFSSIFIGYLADKSGKRKIFLGPLVLIAGILSITTSFANQYEFILVCRFLSGCCIGASLSMMVSIVYKNLINPDFGARSGFISCGSAVLSSSFGPLILTTLVLSGSWRSSFRFTGIALLITGLLIQLSVKEVKFPIKEKQLSLFNATKQLLSEKKFVICLLIGICETAGKMALTIFGPVYLTNFCEISTKDKGLILSIMGILYIPVNFIIPFLADKFKPNKVMLVTFLICTLAPLTMVFFIGSKISVILYMILGNWAAATVSIFIYLVPGQVLPSNLIGFANGIIMGVSVFFGGFICPILFGKIADSVVGFKFIMSVCALVFIACAFLSLVLDKNGGKK